eukprot:4446061-Prymnesium_polylepis.1
MRAHLTRIVECADEALQQGLCRRRLRRAVDRDEAAQCLQSAEAIRPELLHEPRNAEIAILERLHAYLQGFPRECFPPLTFGSSSGCALLELSPCRLVPSGERSVHCGGSSVFVDPDLGQQPAQALTLAATTPGAAVARLHGCHAPPRLRLHGHGRWPMLSPKA